MGNFFLAFGICFSAIGAAFMATNEQGSSPFSTGLFITLGGGLMIVLGFLPICWRFLLARIGELFSAARGDK